MSADLAHRVSTSVEKPNVGALLRPHRAPSVVTIGTFDGVHAGHRALIGSAHSLARKRGLVTIAITFSPRPEQILSQATALPDLCPLDERVRRLRRAGADDVVVLSFTRGLAAVSASEFVRCLTADLGMRVLCVGADFALGRGREGTVEALRGLGIEVFTPPFVMLKDGTKVSSSAIRLMRARRGADDRDWKENDDGPVRKDGDHHRRREWHRASDSPAACR